jgi:ribulose-5-phosphate 4-epimerase/fuculose-1-phosphate aldolase
LQRSELEAQFLAGCRRLAEKGFLNSSSDSMSVRIPGTDEMVLVSGLDDWREVERVAMRTQCFTSEEPVAALHGSIYLERHDAGAIAVSSPKGVEFLARSGGNLPPLFDEQVRHIGLPSWRSLDEKHLSRERIRETFSRGANAALLSERLLCIGMTCERVVFNSELLEKCAQAYVIAKASGTRPRVVPFWVRMIANRRLLNDERNAAKCFLNGQFPEGTASY